MSAILSTTFPCGLLHAAAFGNAQQEHIDAEYIDIGRMLLIDSIDFTRKQTIGMVLLTLFFNHVECAFCFCHDKNLFFTCERFADLV